MVSADLTEARRILWCMSFRSSMGQYRANSKCLTFLLFDTGVSDAEPDREYELSTGRAVLTCSLETGIVSARHPLGGVGVEPMTEEKLSLLAVELGIWAPGETALPHAVSDPEISAVVVSPQGHVFHWADNGEVAISDVAKLTSFPEVNISRPERRSGSWATYRLEAGQYVGFSDNPTDAVVGNRRQPFIDNMFIPPDSPTECAARTAMQVEESGNDPLHPGILRVRG